MRIIGIDPGLATIGIGIVDATSHHDLAAVDWMTITTKPGALAERLRELDEDLAAVLRESKPDLAVIERLFFAANEQSAIEVAHARGVILRRVAAAGIPLMEPTPLQMKLVITGDGRADKKQVQTMLGHMLKLTEIPRPDDAADALALAAYGALQNVPALPITR